MGNHGKWCRCEACLGPRDNGAKPPRDAREAERLTRDHDGPRVKSTWGKR